MKRALLWTSIALLLALLSASAYLAARLWLQDGGSRFPGIGSRNIQIELSPALPDRPPDLVGIFVRRQDNSLFVGTGNIKFQSVRENDAAPRRFESSYDGPLVEVVTTHATLVYFDRTAFSEASVQPDGKVQQVIQPGSLDEMGRDHLIQAWGERQGERFLAQVLVIYSPPGN